MSNTSGLGLCGLDRRELWSIFGRQGLAGSVGTPSQSCKEACPVDTA